MKKFLILLILSLIGNNVFCATISPEQLKADGIMIYSVNKINEAKEVFEKIPEDKRDAQTWLLLSNIAQDLQDTQNIEKYLQNAIAKDSKFYKAYYNLGNIKFNNGKIEEAMANYKLAAKYNKKNSYIFTNIGCCYLAKKNLGMAKYYFNKAATLNPNNPNNYYNLAYIYKEKGNKKKAEELLNIYNTLMKTQAE